MFAFLRQPESTSCGRTSRWPYPKWSRSASPRRGALLYTLAGCVCLLAATLAAAPDITRYDPRMAVDGIVVTNGLKWIDGRLLPIEGRAFDDTEHYYDRLPVGVTTNVNGGVRVREGQSLVIRSVNGWGRTPRNARFTELSAISTL